MPSRDDVIGWGVITLAFGVVCLMFFLFSGCVNRICRCKCMTPAPQSPEVLSLEGGTIGIPDCYGSTVTPVYGSQMCGPDENLGTLWYDGIIDRAIEKAVEDTDKQLEQ